MLIFLSSAVSPCHDVERANAKKRVETGKDEIATDDEEEEREVVSKGHGYFYVVGPKRIWLRKGARSKGQKKR